MADLIDPSNLDNFAKKVPEWEIDGDNISRTFEFDEFMEAIDFVNSVAEIAEEAQHHPDMDIRFNTVLLTLTTHDLGGLTKSDFDVAARIDNLVD
ncbi:MAG: 4a-hydroxytetrahydrobiopterin dehydratase [Verrucomicrobiales bacterium]